MLPQVSDRYPSGMSTRDILKYPDARLEEPCHEVEDFDDELRELADDMVQTMHANAGIGLAAPQVGEDVRLTVVDLSAGADPDELLALVKGRGEAEEGEAREEEGCLSFPELILVVPRPERVVVRARDLDGEEVHLEADGLLARCLHHEIDHLDGVLFIERVSPLKRDLALRKVKKRIRAGDW